MRLEFPNVFVVILALLSGFISFSSASKSSPTTKNLSIDPSEGEVKENDDGGRGHVISVLSPRGVTCGKLLSDEDAGLTSKQKQILATFNFDALRNYFIRLNEGYYREPDRPVINFDDLLVKLIEIRSMSTSGAYRAPLADFVKFLLDHVSLKNANFRTSGQVLDKLPGNVLERDFYSIDNDTFLYPLLNILKEEESLARTYSRDMALFHLIQFLKEDQRTYGVLLRVVNKQFPYVDFGSMHT